MLWGEDDFWLIGGLGCDLGWLLGLGFTGLQGP